MLINSNIMTIKKYQRVKIVITVILAVIFSQAVIYKNYIIPLVALIVASLILLYLRRHANKFRT